MRVTNPDRSPFTTVWAQPPLPSNGKSCTTRPSLPILPSNNSPGVASTNAMASDIFNALKKRDLPNGHLLVEGCQFESKERVMEAIHDLERQLQFALRSAKITRTVKAGGSACHSEGE